MPAPGGRLPAGTATVFSGIYSGTGIYCKNRQTRALRKYNTMDGKEKGALKKWVENAVIQPFFTIKLFPVADLF
jgi:hypothetical protein